MSHPLQTIKSDAGLADVAGGSAQTPTLSVERVGFGYRPGRPVLSEVDAGLMPGRLTALLGPNATGKTTLLRLMLGQRRPDAGRVLLDGRDVGGLSDAARARRVAYVAQRSPVAFGFTVRQIVAMGRYAQSRGRQEARVARAIGDCDLGEVADRAFNELSGGQQQRVSVARALAQSGWGDAGAGRAVLLDEPVSSADLRHAHQTMALLKRAADAGRAVLVVLHDLNLAARWADEVWLMDRGRLVFAGDWREALTPQRLNPIYGVSLTPLHAAGDDRPVFHAAVAGLGEPDRMV